MSSATPGDENKLKEMIEAFYAIAGQTPPLQINDKVAEVFVEMLRAAEECSKAMNYVPLPLGSKIVSGAGAVSWVATYVHGVVFNSFSKKLDLKCVKLILSYWDRKLDMAGQGL